jgi:hypothetical protein
MRLGAGDPARHRAGRDPQHVGHLVAGVAVDDLEDEGGPVGRSQAAEGIDERGVVGIGPWLALRAAAEQAEEAARRSRSLKARRRPMVWSQARTSRPSNRSQAR